MDKKTSTKCTKEIHSSSFQNSLKYVLISFKISRQKIWVPFKSFNGEDNAILFVHRKVPIRRAVIPGYTFSLSSALFITSKIFLLILSLSSHFPYRFIYLELWVTDYRKPDKERPQLCWKGRLGYSPSQAEAQLARNQQI